MWYADDEVDDAANDEVDVLLNVTRDLILNALIYTSSFYDTHSVFTCITVGKAMSVSCIIISIYKSILNMKDIWRRNMKQLYINMK